MSMLYLPKEQQTTTMTVELSQDHEFLFVEFNRDCGKFGTIESLASFTLKADRLLEILQDRQDITDDELT